MNITLSDSEARLLEELVITEVDRLANGSSQEWLEAEEETQMLVSLAARLRPLRTVPPQNIPDFDDEVPF
jgi:hypothetical protein